jgi:hypothetical protein
MKKALYFIIIAAVLYYAYVRIVKPFIATGKGTVTNLYFGNASVPPH